MNLTNEDLDKIRVVVDACQEATCAYVDRRFEQLRKEMATTEDVRQSEVRLTGKLDGVKTMLEGDHGAVVEDIENLKIRVTALEAR